MGMNLVQKYGRKSHEFGRCLRIGNVNADNNCKKCPHIQHIRPLFSESSDVPFLVSVAKNTKKTIPKRLKLTKRFESHISQLGL